MIFAETKLKGVVLLQPERMEDKRGYFSRLYCKDQFARHGLNANFMQASISYNKKKGTFRGMHIQTPPFAEDKHVTCIGGSLVDYVIDLRRSSPTYLEWINVELSEQNGFSLYIPRGCAHGFYTLEDNTHVLYQMTQVFSAAFARGFRWNDPAFNITLPGEITSIVDRDRMYPDFNDGSIAPSRTEQLTL
jgi:dTDP-4-dehydrorhamnose 3,5-epimerase